MVDFAKWIPRHKRNPEPAEAEKKAAQQALIQRRGRLEELVHQMKEQRDDD